MYMGGTSEQIYLHDVWCSEYYMVCFVYIYLYVYNIWCQRVEGYICFWQGHWKGHSNAWLFLVHISCCLYLSTNHFCVWGGGVYVWSMKLTIQILSIEQYIKGRFTHGMPRPCRSPAMLCINSHMPCRAPAMLRQCCVLRESLRGSRSELLVQQFNRCLFCSVLLPLFTVAGMDHCEEDWYASDNNVRGTPRGSRKKPNAGG